MGEIRRNIRGIAEVIEQCPGSLATAHGHNDKKKLISALESGKVLFFPDAPFELLPSEVPFLRPEKVAPKAKNISFNPATGELKHAVGTADDKVVLGRMMRRYAEQTTAFVKTLFPSYATALEVGRTSFRPVEIQGRVTSERQNDTLLHVDAFPASPLGTKRILRIFTNINPSAEDRFWRLGEPFEDVARTFIGTVPPRIPGVAKVAQALGLTKGYRSRYDHIMLNIHDGMKKDSEYQICAVQNDYFFPAASSWLVFTDQVSHAAMRGQHLLEQTFYLPVSALDDRQTAPLSVLERMKKRQLV